MPPETSDDTSSLERLRRELYTNEGSERVPDTVLAPAAPAPEPAAAGWAPPAPPPPPKKRKLSFAVLFLAIAGAFFLVAVAGAAYFLVFGGRAVSSDRITLTPEGPTSVNSGDVVTLLISIENRNPVAALSTTLVVDLPDTARDPEHPELPLADIEDTAGDIPSGETRTRSVRAILSGAEGDRIAIPVRFEYRIEGSDAVFVKEGVYEAAITSSPVSITAEAVSEVAIGQPVSFAVTVRSNASGPLENVAVLLAQPFPSGFALARGEGPVFPVGRLEPGESRTITVTGSLSGENRDERFFRFVAGLRRPDNTNALLASYATAIAPVTLARPFLAATLSLNRETAGTQVIAAGAPVQAIVSWTNTLAGQILDGQVEVKLSGAALDPSSVSAYGGFYRSSDTTVVFARDTEGSLARLDPGASGSGSFTFRTKPGSALAGTRNPAITATVSVAGRRVGESGVPERVSNALTRTMKVGTDLTLAADGLYSAGAFRNVGPWPPMVDQETTYTVSLTLKNTVNAAADATVTATLPSYVRFVAASDASVSYNAATRTVSWKAGEVPAGTGYGASPRAASFQVALLPSASQRGTSPILVSGITLSAFDRFAEKQIEATRPDITTQLLADPAFVQGKGAVR
jgi:hypothetical protein